MNNTGARIAIITPDYPPEIKGGAGVSCQLLARELRRIGAEVDVYAFVSSGVDGTTVHDDESKRGRDFYLTAPESLYGASARIFANMLWSLNREYDLFHVYNVSPIPAVRLASIVRGRRTPVVATLNGPLLACINFERNLAIRCDACSVWKSLECASKREGGWLTNVGVKYPMFHATRLLGRGLSHYIAVSTCMKEKYAIAGIPADHISVVPNMVDTEFSVSGLDKQKCRAVLGIPLDMVVVLFVGTFRPVKGAPDLLRAVSMLPKNVRDKCYVILLGKGVEEVELLRLIGQLEMEGRIRLGFAEYKDLPRYYAASDIFVHPARWPEPFSRTWLEAMQSGLPVLSSRNDAAEEVFGRGGVYYDPFNIEEMSEKLKFLIEERAVRQELGSAGLSRVLAFAPGVVLERTLKVYASQARVWV